MVRMWQTRRFFPLIAGLAIAGCVSACAGAPQSSEPFSFAELPITYSAVTHIAEARSCFSADGLPYASVAVPAGPDVVNALKSTAGSSPQAGGIAITPVITMVAAGDEPVVIATTLQSNRQAKLVTFAGAGVSDNPATLRGKRIGVTRNTNGDIYLSRLLKKGGLTENDATLVNARPAELSALLVKGTIDAAILWDPFVVQTTREYAKQPAAGLGRGEVRVFVDPTLHTLAFNVVTTRAKATSHRDALVRLLRGSVCAEQYIAEHRLDAQRELERWLKLQDGDLDDFFATTQFHVQLNLPQVATWMREELGWLRERNPQTAVPADLERYINPTFLAAIDSSRIIRGVSSEQ